MNRRTFLTSMLATGAGLRAGRGWTFAAVGSRVNSARMTIADVRSGEDLFAWLDRVHGGFDLTKYRQVLGAANPYKEGDDAQGVAADGDSVVLFRGSDVVAVGDLFSPDSYPFLDLERGGSVQGEIDALNHILELTVPAHTQEGGTYVVPGHGRLCDEADVVEYRDMVVIVRDRILDMLKRSLTLDQIKAAKPTLDYDGRYASAFMTADRFVESVYRSLTQK